MISSTSTVKAAPSLTDLRRIVNIKPKDISQASLSSDKVRKLAVLFNQKLSANGSSIIGKREIGQIAAGSKFKVDLTELNTRNRLSQEIAESLILPGSKQNPQWTLGQATKLMEKHGFDININELDGQISFIEKDTNLAERVVTGLTVSKKHSQEPILGRKLIIDLLATIIRAEAKKLA